ncbi:MAG: tetratricopeptide repeat protein [Bacteroidetes bacterium]|jgi:tetratricopeptide (TPR) repeat protein|nr:tetratricopeptide repeat protein [Bacteroidota bacterium]
MSKEIKDEPIVDVENALGKTELFVEENKKSILIIAGAIVALVGGYFAYKYWYVAGEETKAQTEMFKAERYFEQDSLDKAINGDGVALGFAQITEDYGITPSGNLAEYYLGISYLKKGQFEDAIEHLQKFDSKDQIVAPVATGAIGDAHLELGRVDEAITFYLKAAEQNGNKFTTPIYLKKAGMANEDKGNYADAVKLYERIKVEFAETMEGREMEKFIARAKALGNL